MHSLNGFKGPFLKRAFFETCRILKPTKLEFPLHFSKSAKLRWLLVLNVRFYAGCIFIRHFCRRWFETMMLKSNDSFEVWSLPGCTKTCSLEIWLKQQQVWSVQRSTSIGCASNLRAPTWNPPKSNHFQGISDIWGPQIARILRKTAPIISQLRAGSVGEPLKRRGSGRKSPWVLSPI